MQGKHLNLCTIAPAPKTFFISSILLLGQYAITGISGQGRSYIVQVSLIHLLFLFHCPSSAASAEVGKAHSHLGVEVTQPVCGAHSPSTY